MVFTDVGLTGRAGLSRRSIGDNRSTMPAEAAYGFHGCWSYGSRGLIALIDWGQSIKPQRLFQ